MFHLSVPKYTWSSDHLKCCVAANEAMRTSGDLDDETILINKVYSDELEKQRSSLNGLTSEHLQEPAIHPNKACKDVEDQPALSDGIPIGANNGSSKALIPDLFKSFLAEPPRISHYYHEVKIEAETEYFKLFNFSDAQKKLRESAQFPLLMSIVFPEKGKKEELRTQADHFYWYFDFDDRFDEGDLSNDPAAAKAAIDDALEALREDGRVTIDPVKDPLNYVHQTIWHRVYCNSTDGARKRWRRAMQDYIRSVGDATKSNSEVFEEPEMFIKARIHNIGVESFFHMIEWVGLLFSFVVMKLTWCRYAYKLDLPDSFFDHSSVVGLHELCCEIITL